jgi:hypothetical protein
MASNDARAAAQAAAQMRADLGLRTRARITLKEEPGRRVWKAGDEQFLKRSSDVPPAEKAKLSAWTSESRTISPFRNL